MNLSDFPITAALRAKPRQERADRFGPLVSATDLFRYFF